MTIKAKVGIGIGVYVLVMVAMVVFFGASGTMSTSFVPQNEFKLDPWIDGPGPIDINKGVFYIVLAGVLTVGSVLWVSKRMEARPNRVQTAVEWVYELMRDSVVKDAMDPKMAAKYFPLILTLFIFIWISNFIGFIPLPVGTAHPVTILGVQLPTFALYAATANLAVPLVLALIVWVSFNVEGIRKKGLVGYLKGLIPEGVTGPMAAFIFVLEVVSTFMRLISLSVRLFANILAGHFIILFMAGGLAVLLGLEFVGVLTLPFGIVLFLFEVGLVVTLQAFIFATLTAIYLGDAVAESH